MSTTLRGLIALAAAAVSAGLVLGATWAIEVLYALTWGRP